MESKKKLVNQWKETKKESELDSNGQWIDKKVTFEKRTKFNVDSLSKLISALLAPIALIISVYSISINKENSERALAVQSENQKNALELQKKNFDSLLVFNYNLAIKQKQLDFFSKINQDKISEQNSLYANIAANVFSYIGQNSPDQSITAMNALQSEYYAKILSLNDKKITFRYESIIEKMIYYGVLSESVSLLEQMNKNIHSINGYILSDSAGIGAYIDKYLSENEKICSSIRMLADRLETKSLTVFNTGYNPSGDFHDFRTTMLLEITDYEEFADDLDFAMEEDGSVSSDVLRRRDIFLASLYKFKGKYIKGITSSLLILQTNLNMQTEKILQQPVGYH